MADDLQRDAAGNLIVESGTYTAEPIVGKTVTVTGYSNETVTTTPANTDAPLTFTGLMNGSPP